MKILIIEDDQSVAELERDYLEINGGFDCDLYDNGNQGLQAALSQDYALVIVDVMLPGLSGFEICRRLREVKDTPVIIISALADDIDKVRGLGLGADDYMTKPFSPSELVARVKAVLNRTMPKPAAADNIMTFGELTIDTASHTVRVSGEDVALTPKEFDLLVFLASNKGIALSREKILQKVWTYDYFGEDRTVDTHVKMLRGHLGKCRSYIATVWGIGYKFDPDAVRG